MIVLGEQTMGLNNHYKIFSVLKNGGFVSLPNNMGIVVELRKGYAIYKLVAVGPDVKDKVLINAVSSIPKKIKPKTTVVEVVEESKGQDYEEGGLFD
jgi:hypothetical protein